MKHYLLLLLVTAMIPLAAQSTRRLYIESLTVAATKSNGKAWDAWNGAPDLKVVISINGKKVFSTKKLSNKFSFSDVINTRLDVASNQKIKIEVIDEDLANNDLVGSKVLKIPELDLLVEDHQKLSFGRVDNLVVFYSKFKELKLNYSRSQMEKAEKALGTNSELGQLYHKIVFSPFAPALKFPGYIIGIEKTTRKKIGMGDLNKFERYINTSPTECNQTEKKFIQRRIDDYSCQFVSHIVEYRAAEKNELNIDKEELGVERKFFYNIYEEIINKKVVPKTAFDKGWKAIAALKEKLKKDIDSQGITHIFLYSMGWDTSQTYAIENYNDLFGNMIKVSNNRPEGPIRPLFIGITWHSKWTAESISKHWEFIQNKASYISKANDADEIGLLWINHLLRRTLIPLKHENNCRFIIVGHSFGTRLLTRGIFSASLLRNIPPIKKTDIDLFVGLQGAFDVRRFIEEEGREGSPYRRFRQSARKFMFTWSPHDKATAIAKWADFVGDLRGYKKSCKYQKTVAQTAVDANGKWQDPKSDDKILMVDATKVVDSHSDIYDKAISELIWDAIGMFVP